MKHPKRPDKGWPWEQPGHSFTVPNFPPGFKPQPLTKSEAYKSAAGQASRAAALRAGKTGTIKGLSAKADARYAMSVEATRINLKVVCT
jgi:hypothetical protein